MTFINTFLTKIAGAFFARSKTLLAFAGILLLALLVACAPPEADKDEDEDTYTVGGTIEGHTDTVSLTLTYGDETDTLSIAAGTETFTFAAKLNTKQSFSISITAPAGQTCSSSRTDGTIADANITDIQISCVENAYSISGTVSDAVNNANVTVSLFLSDADNIDTSSATADRTAIPAGDGSFSFAVEKNDFYYEITVSSSTPNETCQVDAGNKGQVTADITDIAITCSGGDAVTTYSISGSVTDAGDNANVTVYLFLSDQDNIDTSSATADRTAVPAGDGSFSFAVEKNDFYYEITVSSSTPNETCQVDAGNKGQVTADITDIAITCSGGDAVTTYSISGSVTDAGDNANVTVYLFLSDQDNIDTSSATADRTAVPAGDGTFSFANIAENKFYALSITSTTASETCTTSNTGGQVTGNVDNISFTCTRAYSVSVSIQDAVNNLDVTLSLGDASDSLQNVRTHNYVYSSPGSGLLFTQENVNHNQYYKVSFIGENGFQTCVADNPEGQVTSDINILITCTPKKIQNIWYHHRTLYRC